MWTTFAPKGWASLQAGANRRDLRLVGAPPVGQGDPGPEKRYVAVPRIPLPDAPLPTRPLAELLSGRSSCRRFGGAPTTLNEVAALTITSYGALAGDGPGGGGPGGQVQERPVPSGGARYPLEMYLLVRRCEGLGAGVYHLASDRQGHALEQIRGPVPWPAVVRLFLDQDYLAPADLLVVWTAVASRTVKRYGERGFRFLWLEAGHGAQNLVLSSEALGLGSLPLAGFYDRPLADLLGTCLDVEPPLYAVAVGRPTTEDRRLRRQVP